MAIVKIVSGTYGHRPDGSKYVIPVTHDDLPISVSDEEAKRIVEMGVAVYVDAGAVATALAGDPKASPISSSFEGEDGENGVSDPAETDVPDAETLKGMKLDELRDLAYDLGIDVSGAKKKADLIAAILDASAIPSAEDVVE